MNATIESNKTPLTLAEEQELLEAYRASDFDRVGALVGKRIAAEEKKQAIAKAEKEHALEIRAVKLVGALDEIIEQYAYEIAKARGQSGAWAEEAAANDLIHVLAEFLIQADISDGYETDTMVHQQHLHNEQFAFEWFKVSAFADGTLTPIK